MKLGEFTAYIDDTDIDNFGMKLKGYETQSYVRRKTTGVDIPGAHGAQEVPSALSTNGFTMFVVCTGRDADEVNTKIREFFAYMYSTSTARKIVFSDDESVARYAILDAPEKYKVTNGVDNAFAELKLVFYMLDPFMHSTETNKMTKDAENGKDIMLVNEAFECPAIFTLYNPSVNKVSGISLIVNGELAAFSCELGQDDRLVLDTIEYEVRLNGNVRLDFWDGEMPMLRNGNNIIVQKNLQRANLVLSVDFTKKWV